MKELTDTQLGYLAGIVDGEGTISIRTRKPKRGRFSPEYYPFLEVGNTNLRLIARLHSWLGGRVHLQRRRRLLPNSKPIYAWRIEARKAVPVLRALLPFLLLKRQQALLALELYDTGIWQRGRRSFLMPPVELARRQALCDAVGQLNRRGCVKEVQICDG